MATAQCHLWMLPDEVLAYLVGFLPVEDVCSVAQTCRRLHAVSQTASVQARVSFEAAWPGSHNKAFFDRAVAANNFEAVIKMGVACLYGEGVESCPEMAGTLFTAAERIARKQPFVWLLFRPPWASETCSKATIYQRMRDAVTAAFEAEDPSVIASLSGPMFCVAKTLALKGEVAEAGEWFTMSANHGCGHAAVELARLLRTRHPNDAGRALQAVRTLREYAASGSFAVRMALCSEYVDSSSNVAGPMETAAFVRAVVQDAAQLRSLSWCHQTDLDPYGRMRYILVDWLIEVADLKLFCRETLYMSIALVDKVLQKCQVQRRTLQLLGISCMVIAARYLEDDVITIREAAWLTDSTYTYEDVVRTIGLALFASGGDICGPNHHDFLTLYIKIADVDSASAELMHYVSELTLLRVRSGVYPPAQLAAVIFAVTNIARRRTNVWPVRLQHYTGFTELELLPHAREFWGAVFCPTRIRQQGTELDSVNARYRRRNRVESVPWQAPCEDDIIEALAPEMFRELQRQRAEQAAGSMDDEEEAGYDGVAPMDEYDDDMMMVGHAQHDENCFSDDDEDDEEFGGGEEDAEHPTTEGACPEISAAARYGLGLSPGTMAATAAAAAARSPVAAAAAATAPAAFMTGDHAAGSAECADPHQQRQMMRRHAPLTNIGNQPTGASGTLTGMFRAAKPSPRTKSRTPSSSEGSEDWLHGAHAHGLSD